MNQSIENKSNKSVTILKFFYVVIGIIAIVFGIFIYKDVNDFYIKNEVYKLSSDSTHTLVIYRKKGGKQDNSKFRFKIKDTSIANIDELGKITPIKEGETSIEVSSKKLFGNKHKAKLIVVESVAEEIILDNQDVVLNVDDTKEISATVNGDKDVIYSMSYVSSNPDVANVDEYGKITGISEGRTVITITTPNGLTAECYVTVLPKKNSSDNNSVTTSNSNKGSNTNNSNNNNNPVVLPEDIDATGVKLDSTELTIKLGTSSKISAVVLPVTATNRNVTWSSNDSSIVSIDSNGNIKANNIGVAVISAKTNNGKVATCKVTVSNNNVEVTGITLARTSANIFIGDTIGIGSTVLPSNATNKRIIWTSSNPSVATVSNGVVRGLKAGTTTITAKTNNGKTATCVITVRKVPVTKITLNTTSGNLTVGDTLKLLTTITPSNATDKSVVWSSSNTSVATVSNGVVTAKSAGTANITVKSSNGLKSVCKVTVVSKSSKVSVTGVSLSKKSAKINTGSSITLKATVSPSNATNKSVKWSSSNTKVATVSNGVVTAKSAGTAKITVKTSDGSKTATADITVQGENKAEVYFLNTTKTRDSLSNTKINSNEAIIIKTIAGKYILLDTGDNNTTIKKIIYNRLSKLQNSSKVVIDYMIISHSDDDHSGNAVNILKDSKMIVKNLIIKKESKQVSVYKKIISAKNTYSKDTILLTTSSHSDAVISKKIDNYTNMYIYNTQDIYLNNDCASITDYKIKFYSAAASTKKIDNAVKVDGKYVYIKGYNNPKLYTTDKIIPTTNFAAKDRVFYAQYEPTKQKCSSNANSLALLFETKTTAGKKYMYFPNDLENNGYSLFGTDKIYGNGTTFFYSYTAGPKFAIKNSLLVQSGKKIVKKPQEANIAKTIASKIGSGKISIYQESHHGLNNDPYAIKTLGLNNKNVYSIATYFANGKKAYNYLQARSAHSTLNKTKKMYTGYNGGKGVYCSILYSGKVSCKYY